MTSRFSFGLDAQTLWIINYFTFAAAIILGLWYGIWLGLHWYKIVYEDGHGGLFHGFKGHWLGHEGVIKPTSLNQKNQPRPSMPVSITPKSNPAPIPGSVSSSKTIQPVARLSDRSNNGESLKSWEFDDIIKQKTIINTAGAKSRTAVKKSGTVASAKAVAKPKPKSGVTTKSSLVRKTTKKAVDKS